MKKLLVAATVVVLLTGCSVDPDNKASKANTSEAESTQNTIKNIINVNKQIREMKDFKEYKKIVFEDSPYNKYVMFLMEEEKRNKKDNSSTKRTIHLHDYKFLIEKNNVAVAYVEERNVIRYETTEYEEENNYYYVFKKEKGIWKIYDFLPSLVVSDVDTIVDTYKEK